MCLSHSASRTSKKMQVSITVPHHLKAYRSKRLLDNSTKLQHLLILRPIAGWYVSHVTSYISIYWNLLNSTSHILGLSDKINYHDTVDQITQNGFCDNVVGMTLTRYQKWQRASSDRRDIHAIDVNKCIQNSMINQDDKTTERLNW